MYRIIDNKSSGKTGRLMLLAKENNSIFVCNNPKAMQQKAAIYGISGIEFMDYYTYLTSKGQTFESVVIDELEFFLEYVKLMYCGKGPLIGYNLSDGE